MFENMKKYDCASSAVLRLFGLLFGRLTGLARLFVCFSRTSY